MFFMVVAPLYCSEDPIFHPSIQWALVPSSWRWVGVFWTVCNTLRRKQNGWYFADSIFRYIFMNKMFVFWLKFYWSVNSLWPSDVIWRQGSRSTLAQVMVCCLMAPSYYLNQCWLMISEVLWHSPDSKYYRKYLRYLLLKWFWNLLIWDCSQIPLGPMS